MRSANPQDSLNNALSDSDPPTICELLGQRLDPALVAVRHGHEGHTVAYIEGYQAINQANRIFGYGRWGSEIVGPIGYRRIQGAPNPDRGNATVAMYSARIRVKVHGYESRSDVGCALVTEPTADAHETAIKAAVTDGMKRALRQFGDQFGNALYDRADPSRLSAQRELADLRASVIAVGAQLGLDEAAARIEASRRTGRPFVEIGVRELASLLRAMAEALANGHRAA